MKEKIKAAMREPIFWIGLWMLLVGAAIALAHQPQPQPPLLWAAPAQGPRTIVWLGPDSSSPGTARREYGSMFVPLVCELGFRKDRLVWPDQKREELENPFLKAVRDQRWKDGEKGRKERFCRSCPETCKDGEPTRIWPW